MAQLEDLHKSCRYEEFLDKYLVFPAAGVQPPKSFNFTSEASCDVFSMVVIAALDPNPCFNVYEINSMCPIVWDVLGFPTVIQYTPAGSTPYFNRSDVQEALHAPNVDWALCS